MRDKKMPLTPTQISEYVNLQALGDKKQLEIVAVEYIPPTDLEPTRDTEIKMKHAEIEVFREEYAKNPKARKQYIKDMQPMKDTFRTLQASNEEIKKRNRVKEEKARQDHSDKIAPLQAELETIQNNIKTFLAEI